MRITCIITESSIDLPPQNVAYRLKDSPYLSFLDSSLVPDKYSKFSYIGWDPSLVIKSSGVKNEIHNILKKINTVSYRDPLGFFREHVDGVIPHPGKSGGNIRIITDVKGKGSIPDFKGGFMGYLSYDLKDYLERLPSTVDDDLKIPLLYFGFYTRVLAYSHEDEKWYFIRDYIDTESDTGLSETVAECDMIGPDESDGSIRKRAALELKEIESKLNAGEADIRGSIIGKYLRDPIKRIRLEVNLKKSEYIRRVKKAKEYIKNGDIYQVNFSHRFSAGIPIEPMDLYYILREKNAAPYSAYLRYPGFSIGSSSPERFLCLKNDMIETRPIKGTRPRGKDDSQDARHAKDLEESAKDRAELNMIVDLERNDLGKFCYYGTVKVAEHAVIEKYARVMHSVSTVTGQVKAGVGIADMIKATFPGGSITGAPKIRSMEIIDELETVARGAYTGSIGYISVDGTMDLNIVIRTFIIKGGRFYYNVGGGIVADSDPGLEYQETLDKGTALADTLDFFKAGNLKKD